MLFDLKTPWTASGDPAGSGGVVISDAEGTHLFTAENALAAHGDPVMRQAGQDLAGPLAAVVLGAPQLLQAALLTLARCKGQRLPDGGYRIEATDYEAIRSGIAVCLNPVVIDRPAARPPAALRVVS